MPGSPGGPIIPCAPIWNCKIINQNSWTFLIVKLTLPGIPSSPLLPS